MPISIAPTKAAALAGLAALAAALPLAPAHAGEPMQLDTAQLDAVTAGAAAGFTVFGNSDAFGPVSSFSTTNFNAQSTSSPTFSTAGGSITSFSLGLGGGATANADTGVLDVTGDNMIVRPFNASGSNPNYAYDYSAVYVFAYSSEWAIP